MRLNLRPSRLVCLCMIGSLPTITGCFTLDPLAWGDNRPVTVADAIEMTHLGVSGTVNEGTPPDQVAQFSPDRKRFVVVLQKGNLRRNTNDYSVLLWNVAQVFSLQKPVHLLTMSSSSNREAIKGLKWLNSQVIIFIGEPSPGLSQVYTLDVVTHHLRALTHHQTAVIAYDASRDGRILLYTAETPWRDTVDTAETRRNGLVITSQRIDRVALAGNCQHSYQGSIERLELFLKVGAGEAVRVPLADTITSDLAVSLSPDGRYGLVEVFARHVPDLWSGYQDRLLHEFVTTKPAGDNPSSVERFLLLDTASRTLSPLLNAPKTWPHDNFAWISNGKAIVLGSAYLPLNVADSTERAKRERSTFVAEITLPEREVVKIEDQPFDIVKWDDRTQTLLLANESSSNSIRRKAFQKSSTGWRQVAAMETDSLARDSILVSCEQSMNQPPRLFVSDSMSGRKDLLLDLNPQFKNLNFGREETIIWEATDGHLVHGGLYLPPDYQAGSRYPLVIQTHAFDPNKFWIDGPWSSAFAAQPLASKGIIVLQIGKEKDDWTYRSTPKEAPRQMAAYEGAIDYLDSKGFIDRNRVGIIGFSRTAYHVAYTLTHSKYHFAAATLADGFNGGYLELLEFPGFAAEPYAVNGGPPYGATLSEWLRNSPGFNVDKVQSPVRLEAYGLISIFEDWEWYSLMSQMRKPVDFILLPRGTHVLVKPWERLVSQQGNVDWFAFWLKGEDPSPGNDAELERWRNLRKFERQEKILTPAQHIPPRS